MKNLLKPFLISLLIVSVIVFFIQITMGDVGVLQALIVSPLISLPFCLGGLAGILENASGKPQKQTMISCNNCGHIAPGILRCPKCGSSNVRRFHI